MRPHRLHALAALLLMLGMTEDNAQRDRDQTQPALQPSAQQGQQGQQGQHILPKIQLLYGFLP
mgnify:CR=1 FL=1